MYNQFQILDLISFIIHYRCPKKGHFAKMGIVGQKVSHLSVHSPPSQRLTRLLRPTYFPILGYLPTCLFTYLLTHVLPTYLPMSYSNLPIY
jgi:hypothetical protein